MHHPIPPSRALSAASLATAALLAWSPDAHANGPFLEVMSGLDLPLLLDAPEGTDLVPGPSVGAALGAQLTAALAIELFAQVWAAGDIDGDPTPGANTDRSWSQHVFTLAARIEPVSLHPRMHLEAVGGFGFTFLDLRANAADAHQSYNAFTGVLGVRHTVDLAWGLYAGLDLRLLITPSWKDAANGNRDVDTFTHLPLLLSLTVGYELSLP